MGSQKEKTAAEASELLEEIRQLMEFKGENPFKVRAFERAASAIEGRDDLMTLAREGRLTEIDGVGKGISEVLSEFLLKGTSSVRDELAGSIPDGVLELAKIPGLGPKKALQLVEELEVRSVQELEYACRENRLLKIKGFGPKQQQKILDSIAFMTANQGQLRISDAFGFAVKLHELLLQHVNEGRTGATLRVSETGPLRRRMETLSCLDFLIELPAGGQSSSDIRARSGKALEKFRAQYAGALPVEFHYAEPQRFGFELARTTASDKHWEALGAPAPFEASEEEQVYEKLGLPWIPPETRETGEEVELARSGALQQVLPWDGIAGVFHNHTHRSDGVASLEEMVIAAKKLGFKYIGISDHSQTAFYAQGLKVPTLLEQERELREVQEKHPDIRVFWGIESDILADGSLDYEDKVLRKFDFVVASIHSRFQMEREAMTDRILSAIRHPCTRFLGHATGRLLLGRKGYDVDMERVIEEAAKYDVAIEINANPARLDIDWRWGPNLRACGTKVSVNPDAHDTAGLEDTRYGVAVARKALMPRELVINSRSAKDVEKWLKRA